MIDVLRTFFWHKAKTNTGGSTGLHCQVTCCRWNGIVFYVRENVSGIPGFIVSSGERWGDKVCLSRPRKSRQVLELLALERDWATVAAIVKENDGLHRPVLRNSRFTKRWLQRNGFLNRNYERNHRNR